MVALDTDPILTLSFVDKKINDITLQYHPSSLSISEQSKTQNISGIGNTITYIGEQDNTETAISVSTYFTVLTPKIDDLGFTGDLAGVDFAAGFAAATLLNNLRGRTTLDELDAAVSTISLTKGSYDVASGVITGFIPNPSPVVIGAAYRNIIYNLSRALNEGMQFTLNWDLSSSLRRADSFVLTRMDLDVEEIHETTGQSMVVKCDLGMQKHGSRVEVLA